MNKLFLLLFLFGFYNAVAQTSDWHKTKDLEAGYIIEFPSKPEKSKSDVPTDKGSVTMHTYTFQSESSDKNLIYMTAYTKYPDSFFPKGLNTLESRNTVLDNSVDGAVSNVKGTLIAKSEIVFNGYNGRDIKIAIESSGVQYMMRMKTILVGIDLYMAQVICTKENADNLDSKYFLNSFELINVKQ